jgi:hypothetical protein
MVDRMFYLPVYAALTNVATQAFDDVRALNREIFCGPHLEEHLQKIARKYEFEVATIDVGGITGKRRQEKRRAQDGWGERVSIEQMWIDVTIPFSGDPDSFKIMPSQAVIPTKAASIGIKTLTLSVLDNDRTQSEVNLFVAQIKQNLDCLRVDLSGLKSRIGQTIKDEAERRKRQIDTENDRAKKLSFPILN